MDRTVTIADAREAFPLIAGMPSYISKFKFRIEGGLNTVDVESLCRCLMTIADQDSQMRLARLAIAGRNVHATCPNGEEYSFMLSNPDDSFDGFDLFQKEPLALRALAWFVSMSVVKKSIRPSESSDTKVEGDRATL